MLLYNAVFYVLLLCLTSSKSQETSPEILNKSENDKRTLNILDFDSPDSDLWLITKDDPIPLQLNGRLSFDNADSHVQLVNLEQFTRDITTQTRSDNTGISQLTPRLSQIPVINYDRIINSEDRRHISDRSERVPFENPGAVLIQLPPTITEGLWVKPHSNVIQSSVDGRLNHLSQNRNNQNEENRTNNNSDLQAVYLPISDVVSRLPNPEVEPHAELNIPIGQFYQTPLQATAAVINDSVNGSTLRNNEVGSFGQEILILREPGILQSSPTNPLVYHVNDSESSTSSDGGYHVHGNVLTGEDIELLERLGILTSLIANPKNITSDFTHAQNLHRETEINPRLIDNGSQIQLIKFNEERNGNSSHTTLNNIPQFKAAEYHSNIPENVGIHNNAQNLSPYVFLQPQNLAKTNETNGSANPQISYKLIDSQLVEFLHLLGLNTDDFLNQSSVTFSKEDLNLSNESDAEYNKRNSEISISKNYVPAGSFNDTVNVGSVKEHSIESATVTSLSPNLSNESNNGIRRTVKQEDLVQPSVTNGRIQPRVLEEPYVNENEVLQLLANKAITIPEEKLELLKKFQIQKRPYIFGFKQDDGNGTFQHRSETSDAEGVVKGSYSYKDPLGVYRNVSYIADESGFHAFVKSNEPGTVSHSTADAVFMSEAPPLTALLKMMDYMNYKLSTNFTKKS